MSDSTQLELLYRGSDVENGTVPVDYMIDALVGFSGAYNKLARREALSRSHKIRVVGLKPGSTHILVDVLEFAKQSPTAATVLVGGGTAIATGAYRVISDLGRLILGKKHLAGEPVPQAVFNGPTIAILNQSGQPFELTKEQYEFLKNGTLDPELDKLTAPLEEGRVDEFELVINNEALAKVEAKERPYFVHTATTVTSAKDNIWLEGTLNSLSKTGYRGMFHTLSGKHIPYHYVGEDPDTLLEAFKFKGVVRVFGKVRFDADVNPTGVDIQRVELRQEALF